MNASRLRIQESDGRNRHTTAACRRALRIDAACDRFERRGAVASAAIEHYLAEVAERDRPALLRELLELEQELRCGSGETVEPGEYHERLPEIAGWFGQSPTGIERPGRKATTFGLGLHAGRGPARRICPGQL